MRDGRSVALVFICTLLVCNLKAQNPTLEPDSPNKKPVPTVTYDQVFPGAKPAHFSVEVESTGKAGYRSDEVGPEGKDQPNTGDPYIARFVVSETTRNQIFQLAEQAHYFKGDFNYTKGRIANLGTKILTYTEGPVVNNISQPTNGVHNTTTYNYSENPAIQKLTSIFQGISSTLELGARLDYLRRFDKLGLDAELKTAEAMASQNQLMELQVIEPTLRAIANDYQVLNIARGRANHLLSLAQQPPAGH
jgi:hypothetical protein